MAYVSQEMKKQLAPGIKAVLKKYKVKGSISVANHSSLVVTLKEGAIDFGDATRSVNTYWINSHFSGTAATFLTELKAALEGPDFFDHSDSMTDYFHRSHYIDIKLGKWNKPYTVTA